MLVFSYHSLFTWVCYYTDLYVISIERGNTVSTQINSTMKGFNKRNYSALYSEIWMTANHMKQAKNQQKCLFFTNVIVLNLFVKSSLLNTGIFTNSISLLLD